MTKSPREIAEQIIDDNKNVTPLALIVLFEAALDSYGQRRFEEGIRKCSKIAAEYIGIERERAYEEQGHLKSLALGAMESAKTIEEEILSLLPPREVGK